MGTFLTRGRRTAMALLCGLTLGVAACSDDDNGDNGGSVGPDGSPNLPTFARVQFVLDSVQSIGRTLPSATPTAGSAWTCGPRWWTGAGSSGSSRSRDASEGRPVARLPRHLGAEGKHRQQPEPGRPGTVDREPLQRGATRREPVRPAGEQPGQHRCGIRWQCGRVRDDERFHARQADRRGERVRRRPGAVRRDRGRDRRHRRERRLVLRGSRDRLARAPRPGAGLHPGRR